MDWAVPTLSAAENVEAALVPLHVPGAARRRRAAAALDSVSLADRAGHVLSELSGGQQQRVAIARALVKEPQVLLAPYHSTRRQLFAITEIPRRSPPAPARAASP